MKTILVVVKWNNVCLSHESQEHRRSENISPGELAGVYFTIAEVSRVLRPVNKVKLPHMFHDQLKWIVSRPQFPPNIHVAVKVDTKSYIENDIKPPSAYKYREADLLLASTSRHRGSVYSYGSKPDGQTWSRSDLIAVMELKGANVNIL